jgi:lysozyme
MVMQPSENCYALIRDSEGLRLTVYADPAPGAFPTIGYGHKVRQGENFAGGIDAAQAEDLMQRDASEACALVEAHVATELRQGEIDALTDFVFNLGAGQFLRSTLLKLVNAGHYDEAANQFGLWVYAGGHVLPGLVRRRERERQLFISL